MDYVNLGRRIRSYRKAQRLTQEKLAESAGISLSFLGHIERGTRKASIETLIALCNTLNVSPEVLLQDSLSDSLAGMPTTSRRQRLMLNEISRVIMENMNDFDGDNP